MFTRSIKKEQEPEMENYAETVRFHKIPTPGNELKLRYFSQIKERPKSKHSRNIKHQANG